MKESSTYQAILEEGRAEGRAEGQAEGAVTEARKLLRRSADQRFGAPDTASAAALEQINDLARLEELFDRLPTATSWQHLLGSSTPGKRRGRRRSS